MWQKAGQPRVQRTRLRRGLAVVVGRAKILRLPWWLDGAAVPLTPSLGNCFGTWQQDCWEVWNER